MSNQAQRLSALVKELRGSISQGQFAKKLGIGRSTISFWESCLSYPEADNLQKLAHLKGWTLEELQTYLVEGILPTEDPLEQILRKIQTLPSEAVIQVLTVGTKTLADRIDNQELSLKT